METAKQKLIVFNFIFLALLVLASPAIIMSPMMFDAPGSENSYTLWTIVMTLWLYLPVFVVSSVGSIVFYRNKKDKLAVYWSLLPFINVIVFISALAFLFLFCGKPGNCP